jgi:hypothetical protein
LNGHFLKRIYILVFIQSEFSIKVFQFLKFKEE